MESIVILRAGHIQQMIIDYKAKSSSICPFMPLVKKYNFIGISRSTIIQKKFTISMGKQN